MFNFLVGVLNYGDTHVSSLQRGQIFINLFSLFPSSQDNWVTVALGGNSVEEGGSENKAWVGQVHPWVLPLPTLDAVRPSQGGWWLRPQVVGGSFWWTDEEGVREK